MEFQCLPLSELPCTSKLYADFLVDFSRIEKFYAHPRTEAGARKAASEVRLAGEIRLQVARVLREQNRAYEADEETLRNIERLQAGAVAIVTGQQVTLFGGPAYGIYKALSAIAWAKHLTASGVESVPVFWLASEDHDFAEVNHCFWLTAGGLRRVEIPAERGWEGRQVGDLLLGESGELAAKQAADSLKGIYAEDISNVLRASYRSQETFSSAFGKLLTKIFRGRGLVLLDPMEPRFHRLTAQLYRRALELAEPLSDSLLERGQELRRAGYHEQVKVSRAATLLFLNREGLRLPLRGRNGRFSAGETSFTRGELLRAVDESPERFTPNVLLRSIVQDSLLPTAAYVAGPSEIAYFAQSEVLYRALLGRMPAILPRAGFTLVEPHVARLLKKYGLSLADVVRSRQQFRAKIERQAISRGLAERFQEDAKALRRLLARYRKPLTKLDRTLAGALDTTERKMLYQFSKLQGQAGRAENLRSGDLERHEKILIEALYPQKNLQERSLSLLALLAAHGPGLLDALERRARNDSCPHQVAFL